MPWLFIPPQNQDRVGSGRAGPAGRCQELPSTISNTKTSAPDLHNSQKFYYYFSFQIKGEKTETAQKQSTKQSTSNPGRHSPGPNHARNQTNERNQGGGIKREKVLVEKKTDLSRRARTSA